MKKAFEIEYKYKKVEIHIIDFVGDVRNINGTPDLFSLSYNSNINDKGQYILATEAEINIYEDAYFNIDELKTVGETDILIKYFEYDELVWQGFALPDFFQTGITKPRVLRIVATDRLGVLKDIANTSVSNTPKEIIEECLLQTGLSLPVEIRNNNTYLETTTINRERIEGVSAYDVIRTFMVQFNSKIVQYKNKWWIVNKKLLEDGFLGQEIIDIDLVYLDGQREIKPTASDVSLYLEFGGSKRYPKNWNFRETDFNTIFKDWSVQPTDKASTAKIIGYNVTGTVQTPIYGDSVNVPSLEYVSGRFPEGWDLDVNPLMFPAKKSSFTTFSLLPNINYALDFRVNFTSASNINLLAFILLKKGNEYFVFIRDINRDIILESAGTGTPTVKPLRDPITIEPSKRETFGVVQTQWNIELGLDRKIIGLSEDETDTVEVQIIILKDRIYTSPITETTIIIHSAELVLIDREVTGKGLIFKTKQGGDKFSKVRETETTLFSDKINQGVNGYFYNYKYDDTSITNLPKEYLLEMTRQMADMFCSARDFYSLGGKFKVNPLARYKCGNKYFVFVGGESKRETSTIDIEEIVSNSSLTRTDYIYTYFEDSKDNIKSIGTASGAGGVGGGSGGGGMTSSQLEMLTNLADWWKLDEENDAIYSEKSVYSLKGVSALGLGEGGSGGGGGVDMLDSWANYTVAKANYYAPASLLVPFRNDTLSRLASLEAGGGGGGDVEISITGSGNAVTGVSKSGNTLTFAKSSTFAQITDLQSALDSKQNTLIAGANITISGNTISSSGGISSVAWGDITGKPATFAPSAHTHTIANVTDLQTALNGKEPSFTKKTAFNKNFGTVAGTVMQGNDSRIHSHSNKSVIDKLTQGNIDVLNLLSVVDGNIKVDTTLWATGGISALGLGDSGGSGGGGADMLDSWANYTTAKANYYVPASLLVPFRSDTLSRLTSLESGSATSIVTTGNGNAITSLTKLGSVITATKGLTFALGSHTHTFASLTNKPTTLAGYGITDAVTLNTAQTITGAKTFNTNITLGINRYIQGTDNWASVFNVNNLLWRFGSGKAGSVSNIRSEKVGIGTDNPLCKLDVSGTGRFTSSLITPKVDFGNGFTIEPSGTELVFKYNGVIKQRMLSNGTILATGGMTALTTN